jgi:hypothetical protein
MADSIATHDSIFAMTNGVSAETVKKMEFSEVYDECYGIYIKDLKEGSASLHANFRHTISDLRARIKEMEEKTTAVCTAKNALNFNMITDLDKGACMLFDLGISILDEKTQQNDVMQIIQNLQNSPFKHSKFILSIEKGDEHYRKIVLITIQFKECKKSSWFCNSVESGYDVQMEERELKLFTSVQKEI